ncbi:MAG: formylglycine-generating enzyme family protein [Planctomycetota bacterium]
MLRRILARLRWRKLDLAELGALVECLARMGARDAMGQVIEAKLPALRDEDVARRFAEFGGSPLWRRCPPVGTPGVFRMGSPEDEVDRRGDERQVPVFLSEPLWVMSTSVTFGQWSLMADRFAHESHWGKDAQLPITHVTWFEARLFGHWLEHWRRKRPTAWSAAIPSEAAAHGITLPTEAQREYFTRAGTTTRFWSGDGDAGLARVGWYGDNSGGRLHAVGEKDPNAFGLHDVHGNVWEWCRTWYAEDLEGSHDPLGPRSGRGRVLRGGSYGNDAWWCRSASRDGDSPDSAGDYGGFRLVLSAPERPSKFDD